MREGYASLLVCLLLMVPGLLVGNGILIPSSDDLPISRVDEAPLARSPIEWYPLGNETISSFLNDTTEMEIGFYSENGTFGPSEPYDPYFDHNSTVRAAIDSAPQWLNDSLSWRFSEFWSHPGQKWAQLLLNDSVDWRYRDEIAFIIAHLPSQISYSLWVWPELIVENVEMIYKVAEEVPYATLTDTNTSQGLRTTITYSIPGGNVSLPDEIYYENLVMPRNSLERPNYMNRSTRQYTYPDQGWFWRNFLYYEADDGYPVLRDMLRNQTTLWNGTQNQAENNGAIGAVTQWQMGSMIFGMPEHRSSQPVIAYGEHIGMCGENSYLLAAAAKTALIPTVTVINFDWMHGWNMFYDRGWHIWRAYDGIIDDTYAEGGPGSVNAHAAFNPDSSQFNPAPLHTQTANLTVRVIDDNGAPVDGCMVKLYSTAVSNYPLNQGLIGNHTDVNGEAGFEVGVGFQYFAQIISPLGLYLDEDAIVPLALPDPVPGVNHWFNVSLNRSMPLKANLSMIEDQEFGLRFNMTVVEMEQRTRPIVDALGYDSWFWKGYEDRYVLRTFILDDENLSLYKNGSEFFPVSVANITPDAPSSVIVPDGENYHIIIPGAANPLTRTSVTLRVEVERSVVTPEANILTPDPGYYLLGEELHFSGRLYPHPPYIGEVQYRWFKNDTSDPISEEQEFNWTPEVGLYTVTLTIWNGDQMLDSDMVIFEVLMPNRPPESVISSPMDGSVFIAGTEIYFSSGGTSDPDEDELQYRWTERSSGELISTQPFFGSKFIIGAHTIVLNVSDPEGLWSSASVSFNVIKANNPPIPFIRSPQNFQSFYEDQAVPLSANGSFDLDGDELGFLWESDIAGFLSNEMEAEVHLAEGEHTITLTVDDGNVSASQMVTIYVESRPQVVDRRPVANISSPSDGEVFFIRDLINFNSRGSFDPEGYPLDYLWQIDERNVSTSSSFSMYLKEGVHIVSLTVLDLNLSSTVSISLVVTNRAPVINITLNGTSITGITQLNVLENETLVFDASASFDPDGTELEFQWTLNGDVIGSQNMLIYDLLRGTYEFKLTVTDQDGRSSIYLLSINCLRRSDPGTPPDDDDSDKGSISIAFYIIPIVLIVIFLIAATVFFLLSRERNDFYIQE